MTKKKGGKRRAPSFTTCSLLLMMLLAGVRTEEQSLADNLSKYCPPDDDYCYSYECYEGDVYCHEPPSPFAPRVQYDL